MKNIVIKSLGLVMLLGNVLFPVAAAVHAKYNWESIVINYSTRIKAVRKPDSAESFENILEAFKAQLITMRYDNFNFNEPGIVQKAIVANPDHRLPYIFIEALLEMDVDIESKSRLSDSPFLNGEWLTPFDVAENFLIFKKAFADQSKNLDLEDPEIKDLQKIVDLLTNRISAVQARISCSVQ